MKQGSGFYPIIYSALAWKLKDVWTKRLFGGQCKVIGFQCIITFGVNNINVVDTSI